MLGRVALEAEATYMSSARRMWSKRTGIVWWCATAMPGPAMVTTVAGAVEIEAPESERPAGRSERASDAVQDRDRPAVVRKSPKVTEVLPLLYLHGLSTGDFVPALEGFFG